MNIYQLWAQSNDYQSFELVDRDWQFFQTFDGRSHASGWVPLRVKLLDDPEEPPLPASDYPCLSLTVPVLSRKAKDCLEDIIAPHGEFLPMLTTLGEYYVFNVTTLLDALDEQKSVIERFKSGRIMEIEAYQFRREKLTGAPIFKLPQDALDKPLVTDEFIRRVEECGLTGMGFTHVWSG